MTKQGFDDNSSPSSLYSQALRSPSNIVATGDFALAQTTCGRVLFSGRSCTIAVTFVPTASGDRVGELTVFDNAALLLQTVTLSGTGR